MTKKQGMDFVICGCRKGNLIALITASCFNFCVCAVACSGCYFEWTKIRRVYAGKCKKQNKT